MADSKKKPKPKQKSKIQILWEKVFGSDGPDDKPKRKRHAILGPGAAGDAARALRERERRIREASGG